MRKGDSASTAHRPSGEKVSRMVAIVLLLSLAAMFESTRLFSLRDPQIWGHLQVGSWILKNKSWPQSGLFSQAGSLPWRDFNWGFDILTAIAYQWLGLRALPALLMIFRVALAGITFLLAGWRRGNFWGAVALSAVAQYVLAGMGPTPAYVSALLFGAELLLLLEVRRSGNLRLLYAIPVLILLWSNLDLSFGYGIGLYILFLAALAVERMNHSTSLRWVQRPEAVTPLGTALLAGAACVVASCINPYGYQGYAAFFADQNSPVNLNLSGYTAMSFHQPEEYVLLLLTMAAFLWLGVRRSRDLFQLSLLIVCTMLAFHARRENCMVTLTAVAVIGEATWRTGEMKLGSQRLPWSKQTWATIGVTAAMVLLAFTLRVPRQPKFLLGQIAENCPVRASDYIRQHQLPGPLFNAYEWGSFLTWYLPEYPVAIDARRGLYPEQEELDYFKVMNVDMPYQNLPAMKQARTLLLDKKSVMGEALRGVPGFRVAYEDPISIVLLQEEK